MHKINYKKIFALLLLLLLSVTLLVACDPVDIDNNIPKDDPTTEVEDKTLSNALDALIYENLLATDDTKASVTKDLDLPLSDGLVTISWKTTNANIITNAGVVNRGEDNADVTLTATLNYEGDSKTKSFSFTVKAIEKIIDESTHELIATDFTNRSFEYSIKASVVDLHFFNNSKIAYIDITDFINMLDGIYYSEDFEYIKDVTSETLEINYSVNYDGDISDYSLVMNAKADTVSVDTLDYFDNYMQYTSTDYSDGLVDLEPIIAEGNSVLFDLAEYDFDLIMTDGEFLVPFAVANLLFNQSNYFDAYYNGQDIYGIDTSDIDNASISGVLMHTSNIFKTIPEEVAEYNYNYYRFLIDYFYGLKADKEIVSGASFIDKDKFLKGDVSKNIFNVTNDLDDLHTYHISRNFYNNVPKDINYQYESFGPNIGNYYDGYDLVDEAAWTYFASNDVDEYFNQEIHVYPQYINNNKTLIIYVEAFEFETPDLIEAIIKNAKATTTNIIIDITLNGGGNLGAVLRMFTLMTNDEIWYHFLNPLNNEKVSYGVTGEAAAYDQYNYYIKTSSVTFSAANLTASIAKELGIPVIGQKSSGGAAALSFFVFPDGSIINMSSNSIITDKYYNSVEKGITPDIILNNLYSETEINAITNK